MQSAGANELPVFWGHGTADGVIQCAPSRTFERRSSWLTFSSLPPFTNLQIPVGWREHRSPHQDGLQRRAIPHLSRSVRPRFLLLLLAQ